jgi:glycosyltransferase involved in cell wall biosynthesis
MHRDFLTFIFSRASGTMQKKEVFMVQKVCLLVNYNLYESKRYFTQKLADALSRHGLDTRIIDAREGALGADTIMSIRRFSPDITCSFNALLPLSEHRYLWDYLETPHISFLVDPAFYSTNLTESRYSIISCVDRFDTDVFYESGFKNVFFWPHAVEAELSFDEAQTRPFDVVMLGSCYDYESLRASWQQQNPEHVNRILDQAIDIVFSDNRIPLAQALVSAWNASGVSPKGVDFLSLYYYLDNYTRGRDRVELIRSIKNARVHIFGELSTDNAVGVLGWPQYMGTQSNVTIHPSVPFAESLEIMKKSKIILNSMPFFRNGTHERIFAGLACGAVPITSESLYLREQFQHGRDLFYYQAKQRQEVNETVNNLLADESKRQAIARSGRKIVMDAHTWDVRVVQLLNELPTIFGRIYARTSRLQ